MNKISIKSQQSNAVSSPLCASKDTACNDLILVKDEQAVLMMNVIKFLDNTNISQSESEL